MPHHKSSKKRVRQTERKTLRNKIHNSMAKTAIKKVREAIDAKNKEKAVELLPEAQSRLSRLAKTGIIKPNSAARRTSRLTQQVAKIS